MISSGSAGHIARRRAPHIEYRGSGIYRTAQSFVTESQSSALYIERLCRISRRAAGALHLPREPFAREARYQSNAESICSIARGQFFLSCVSDCLAQEPPLEIQVSNIA